MKKDITRAIIDATISRGLREIYEDPRRSIRKFADLGRNYSKARFTKSLYDIIQELLRNDDSPYYVAIEHLLQNTSTKNLKDFGINMGYNSFSKGGKVIRELINKNNMNPSWDLIIRLDPTKKSGITPSELIPFISEARKYGIFTYGIRLENNLSYFEDLLKVFITYDDCSFVFVLPDSELNEDQLSLTASCSNAIYFLPAFGDSFGTNLRLLKKKQAWIGIYAYYDEHDIDSIVSDEIIWDYLPQGSSFLLLIAKDGIDLTHIEKMAQRVKQLRLEPLVPLFLFDLYGDSMQTQRLISEQEYFYEILPDGTVNSSFGTFRQREGLPDLEKLFSKK